MKQFKSYSIITIGAILVALSIEYFFAPNNLAAGGVTGAAIVINALADGKISIGALTFFINIFLFIAAFFIIGGKFGIKTIYATFSLSFFIWIIEKFFHPYAITHDLIIAAVFGSVIAAMGQAMVFNENASTGGTDILAKILEKFIHMDIGKALLCVDFLITLASAMVFGIDAGLYAMLSSICVGLLIDQFISGFNTCKSVFIMSSKCEEIKKFIIEELDRSCTFLYGKGGYTGKNSEILYAIVSRKQFIKLKKYIKETDKNAFITVSEVHEVLGEGFKSIDQD